MSKDAKKAACEKIIHAAAGLSAVGGGLTILPGSDAVVIMPIQVFMVVQLAKVYDVPMSRALARSAAYAALGQILGRGASKVLIGWLPGVGNVIRGGIAFAVTQAIGWAVVEQLESGDLA